MKNRAGSIVIFFIPTVLMLLTLLWYATYIVHYEARFPVYVLRDGWDITYDGQTFTDRSLNDLADIIPPAVHKKEEIRIARTLDMEEIPSPTLGLIVYHLAVEVYLDDVLLASPGMEELRADRFVGGNRYYIDIPSDYSGKRLEVRYYVSENNTYPYIYSLRFGSFHDLIWTFLNEYGYVLVIGVFLLFFGGFFLIFSLFFSILLPEIKGQRLSSILCIMFGIWILTHYRVFGLFTGTRNTMTVEYLAFYTVLPLLYLLVIQVHETPRLFRVFAAINVAAVCISYVLHFTGIYHMHRFRNVFYAMCSVFLALLIWIDVIALRSKRREPVLLLQLGGPTAFCSMIFIAMIVYLLSGGDQAEYTDFSVVLLTTGPLVFAVSRFMIYIRLLMEMTPHKLEFHSLNTLAYIDALTGLNNRTLMGELEGRLGTVDHDYCLISFDLNGLKLVNDTEGHAAGDRLLRDFAHVLRGVFPKEAYLMRIGGDEFLVIWEYVGEERVRKCLRDMELRFAALDKETGIEHSAAAGYAFRHEMQGDSNMHKVFLEADKRMYENKQMQSGIFAGVRL